MNIKKLLAEMGDSGQRERFYQDLIAMLAVESEISYPDKVCPGPEYDAAIRRLTAIIKVKGKIHAFYNLNCRWGVVPGARAEGQDAPDAGEFFQGLFRELDQEPDIQGRFYDIVQSCVVRVLRGGVRNQVGTPVGEPVGEKDCIRKHRFTDPALTALSRVSTF